MSERTLTLTQDKELTREEMRTRDRYLTPAVDIFETDEGLTLIADVPGLDKDHLKVDIDQGVLTIEGAAGHDDKGERLFEEFAVAGYFRQFRLPDSIDPDRTEAELKDGVLTLHLPKAEAARPKKIAIKTVH
ncbi:HSP20 family molecular chaperone IbpA [Geothermobacter ehrlichii]|uniref:HSP20 family molecular chaperone IbpA n=1 Tax=Geothermobacter ehrlichii TaxID=213224 RepID=A0A5D3WKX4_9BACT|nr:Hsp20/alpha crystallin family protein [Geothermobacter ehrlichii]TYO98140.1 HSP20 family molecular chaperone IbpA [Geothermobacter ehrlichii]